jgi:hypothetical protein
MDGSRDLPRGWRHRPRGRLIAIVTVCVAAFALSTPALAMAQSSADRTQQQPTCVHPLITYFAFSPRSVATGATTVLTADLSNCTDKAFSGSFQSFGKWGCIVLDPARRAVHLAAGSSTLSKTDYQAPNCRGTGAITGQLIGPHGTVISSKTAKVTFT